MTGSDETPEKKGAGRHRHATLERLAAVLARVIHERKQPIDRGETSLGEGGHRG